MSNDICLTKIMYLQLNESWKATHGWVLARTLRCYHVLKYGRLYEEYVSLLTGERGAQMLNFSQVNNGSLRKCLCRHIVKRCCLL